MARPQKLPSDYQRHLEQAWLHLFKHCEGSVDCSVAAPLTHIRSFNKQAEVRCNAPYARFMLQEMERRGWLSRQGRTTFTRVNLIADAVPQLAGAIEELRAPIPCTETPSTNTNHVTETPAIEAENILSDLYYAVVYSLVMMEIPQRFDDDGGRVAGVHIAYVMGMITRYLARNTMDILDDPLIPACVFLRLLHSGYLVLIPDQDDPYVSSVYLPPQRRPAKGVATH